MLMMMMMIMMMIMLMIMMLMMRMIMMMMTMMMMMRRPSSLRVRAKPRHLPIDKKGDKGRQDLGKADTPSNTSTYVGTMGDNSETRRQEGGHTISRDHGRQ